MDESLRCAQFHHRLVNSPFSIAFLIFTFSSRSSFSQRFDIRSSCFELKRSWNASSSNLFISLDKKFWTTSENNKFDTRFSHTLLIYLSSVKRRHYTAAKRKTGHWNNIIACVLVPSLSATATKENEPSPDQNPDIGMKQQNQLRASSAQTAAKRLVVVLWIQVTCIGWAEQALFCQVGYEKWRKWTPERI